MSHLNNFLDKALIVNLAPTGAIGKKENSAKIPISNDEIVNDYKRCSKHGVSMIHVHARNDDGAPSNDGQHYGEIISRLRELNPELIIVATTSGRGGVDVKKRATPVFLKGDAKPDMASLTLSSMNFLKQASINSPQTIDTLLEYMHENNVKPELEVFDIGMINYAKHLIDKGFIKPPFYFNLILGNIAGAQSNLSQLGQMITELPDNSIWSVGGIGNAQLNANTMGVTSSYGVRVGLEDNIWQDMDKNTLATNESLVERIATLANTLGRPISNCKQTRALLGL